MRSLDRRFLALDIDWRSTLASTLAKLRRRRRTARHIQRQQQHDEPVASGNAHTCGATAEWSCSRRRDVLLRRFGFGVVELSAVRRSIVIDVRRQQRASRRVGQRGGVHLLFRPAVAARSARTRIGTGYSSASAHPGTRARYTADSSGNSSSAAG